MKLRRLSQALIGLVSVSLSIPAVLAQTPVVQTPVAPPPTATTPPTPLPAPVPAPSAPQQMHPQFPQMPPPPPLQPPVDVNSPGIEAKVPSPIAIPGVAAVVNGKAITYAYLVKKFLAAGAPQFLDEIINEQLIRQQAAKEGVVVTPAETTAKMNEAKRFLLPQYPGMTWAQFLALQGRSESYIRDNIYDGLLAVKLVEKNMPDNNLVGKIHIYHILKLTSPVPNGPAPASDADAKAEIEAIAADIQSGKDTFQDEARKESQDSSASKGGDLGWVGSDSHLDPTFAAAAFKLKEGEISPPVKSQYGWHLIYCEKYGIHATKTDLEVYQATLEERARQQIQPYLKQLHDSAKIIDNLLPQPAPPPVSIMPSFGGRPAMQIHQPMPSTPTTVKPTP